MRQWNVEQRDTLDDPEQQLALTLEAASWTAQMGSLPLAKQMVEEALVGYPDREMRMCRWMSQQEALAGEAMAGMESLGDQLAPVDRIEILYHLAKRPAEKQGDRELLLQKCRVILDSASEFAATHWAMLSSTLDLLSEPELALRAIQQVLSEDDATGMANHYRIWLQGGYLGATEEALNALDELVVLAGPLDDLMDTRAMLLMRAGRFAEAEKIVRALMIHQPLNQGFATAYQIAKAGQLDFETRRESVNELIARCEKNNITLGRTIAQDLLTP